jgi:hypothetical protein
LVEAIAKNLIETKIAAVGPDEWARRAAAENLTVEQFTEIEVWQATGPISYQFMALSSDVTDAVCDLIGVEVPPVWVPDMRIVG